MQPITQPIDTLKTAEQFYAFFSLIPEQQWCTGQYAEGIQHCTLGHLGERNGTTIPACTLLERILEASAATINDGQDQRYQQPTPKQRILAALKEKFTRAAAGGQEP